MRYITFSFRKQNTKPPSSRKDEGGCPWCHLSSPRPCATREAASLSARYRERAATLGSVSLGRQDAVLSAAHGSLSPAVSPASLRHRVTVFRCRVSSTIPYRSADHHRSPAVTALDRRPLLRL